MTFVNPAILWALPLGLAPIIIYYLMRYRSLRVTWGANYVLERALERLRKKLYLDQIILLALRVLACLALVLAFARPASSSRATTLAGSGIHHVVVLDGSYSMLAGPKDRTRWDQSRDVLKCLAQSWGRGETWSVLLATDKPAWVVDSATIDTPQAAAATIDTLAPSECASDLGKALEAVAAKFPAGNIDLYVFADDQASAWKTADRAAVPKTADGRIVWVNVPLDSRGNLAVTAVRFATQRVLVGHPVRVFVSIRNFGPEAAQDAPVEFLLDGVFYGKETVSLLPGQEGVIHSDVMLPRAGSHSLTVRLGPDALEFDNRMSAAAEAVDKISVAVLRDGGKTGKFDSAWSFLQIVSQAEARKDSDGEPIFTLGPLALSLLDGPAPASTLAASDVVLLDGGRTIDVDLAGALRQYVADGGALVLAADEGVDARAWRALLAPAGLMPTSLGRLHVESLGGEHFAALSRSQPGLGAMRTFETDEDGDLGEAKFYSWFELGEPNAGGTVLARFAGGEPYAVERRQGDGTVVLLAAGLSGRGNNLVAREFYLPLLYRLFSHAASGGSYPQTLAVGEPIRLRVDGAVRGATWEAPGKAPTPATVTESPGGATVSVAEGCPVTGLGSLLVVRDDGTTRVWIAAQGPRCDSDLAPMDEESARRLAQRFSLVQAANWAQLDQILQAARTGQDWHHWVLVMLTLVLVGEMWMERRFV